MNIRTSVCATIIFLLAGFINDAMSSHLNVSATTNDNTVCAADMECECRGRLTSITLVYDGPSGVTIHVYSKRPFISQNLITSFSSVQSGQTLTVHAGASHFRSYTYFWLAGTSESEATKFNTNCSEVERSVTNGYFTLIGFTDSRGNSCDFLYCNGSIDLTVTGGTAPYSYRWSNGSSTQDQNHLCPGRYKVKVTDSQGFFQMHYININNAPSICSDDNLCTADKCETNGCTNKPIKCNDQNRCTIDECVNGECVFTSLCNDDNSCTVDYCSGEWGFDDDDNGRDNDDDDDGGDDDDDNNDSDDDDGGNFYCYHRPIDCREGDLCTVDECIDGECIHTPKDCNDGDFCTNDGCYGGRCKHHQIVNCGSDPCSNMNCDDSNSCTNDACHNGQCSNTVLSCDDNNACTTDICSSGNCINTAINCDDGDLCTVDECLSGQCSNITISCDDNNACTSDNCLGGTCLSTAINCDDDNSCTDDACNLGQCSNTAMQCNDNEVCTSDECISGQCYFHPILCDDGNPCTIDACDNGTCKFNPINCDDSDICTLDYCDNNGQCGHAAISGCGDLCANSGLAASATGAGPNPCNDCNGSASVDITGGTSPYTILWSNGETTSSIGGSGQVSSTSICINAGGSEYLALNGDVFLDDQYYNPGTPGTVAFRSNSITDILGTDDDELYLTERNAAPSPSGDGTMSYNIPVTNGLYDVELHFAELYFGVDNLSQPITGKRVFDVLIEGTLALDNYDINADVGPATAVIKSFTSNVSDGILDIQFISVVNRAKISAICIKPHPVQGGSGLCSGTYSVTVTDANGCTASASVTLCEDLCATISCDDEDACTLDECTNGQCAYVPIACDDNDACTLDACSDGECSHTPVLTIDVSGADPSPCDDCNGSATASPLGGTAPYSYLWSTGATTQTAGNSQILTPFLCLNSGGPQFVSLDGETFSADAHFSGSTFTYANNTVSDIAGTDDDALFRTERNTTGTMFYSIPAPDGEYEVELYFAELYFGVDGGLPNPVGGIIGKRVFDVFIEGALVLDNYDINADVGPATAVTKTFTATVSGSFLDIQFTSVTNRAKVSAICVRTISQTQGLCAGSYSVTVTDAGGCTASAEVMLCPANKMSAAYLNTGLSEEISRMIVYPVPLENQLNIEFTSGYEGKAEIRIVDMLGQIVKSEAVEMVEGENRKTIELQSWLADGMYFLEFRTGDKVQYAKLYKSK